MDKRQCEDTTDATGGASVRLDFANLSERPIILGQKMATKAADIAAMEASAETTEAKAVDCG